MSQLPLDSVFCIAEYLPIRNIPSFLLICKEWQSLERYEIFWKTILSIDIITRLRVKISECPQCPYKLESLISKRKKHAKAKISSAQQKDIRFIMAKSSIDHMASFYQLHIVNGKALSRQSFKKFIDQKELHECGDDEDEEEFKDDQVFGTRFKYLTQQYVTNILFLDYHTFFQHVRGQELGPFILGISADDDLISKHLRLFKNSPRCRNQQFNRISEILFRAVFDTLSEYQEDGETANKYLTNFLDEYSPYLSWYTLLYSTDWNIFPFLKETLINYAKSGKLTDPIDYSIIPHKLYFAADHSKESLLCLYQFLSELIPKNDWKLVIDAVETSYYNPYRTIESLFSRTDTIKVYMEIMEMKEVDCKKFVTRYGFTQSVLSYFWEENLIPDKDLEFIFHNFFFESFELFKRVFEHCKKNIPTFSVYRCEGVNQMNWFFNYLNNSLKTASVCDVFELVLGSDEHFDMRKLSNFNDDRFNTAFSSFIYRHFFINSSNVPEEVEYTAKDLNYLYKVQPRIFSGTERFDRIVGYVVEAKHFNYDDYQVYFNKEAVNMILSFFDFDGVSLEDHIASLRQSSDVLEQFSITDPLDYQKYNSGSKERTLALYLAIKQQLNDSN